MMFFRQFPRLIFFAFICACVAARAQSLSMSFSMPSGAEPSLYAFRPSAIPLPDAPSSLISSITQPEPALPPATMPQGIRPAPHYATVIEPEYQSLPLSGGEKLRFAASEIVSFNFAAGAVLAGAYSHGVNSDPKYGTNSEAFAKRVGAAGARGASQIILSDGLLAPVFREDPRYYVLGSSHHVLPRALYAASRVLITRTDKGSQTVNFSQLIGYGGSAALTQFYYPVGNRSYKTALTSYGGSLAGLALQNEYSEFIRLFVRRQPR